MERDHKSADGGYRRTTILASLLQMAIRFIKRMSTKRTFISKAVDQEFQHLKSNSQETVFLRLVNYGHLLFDPHGMVFYNLLRKQRKICET